MTAAAPLDLRQITPEGVRGLSDADFEALFALVAQEQQQDRRENQLLYYEPTQPNALKILESNARVIGAGGGNRSSKTDSSMARWVSLATGILPQRYAHILKPKFKGPLRVRMVVESLTVTLKPIILPKLQWWQWSGLAPAGGARGHWGWIPKMCLIDGDWNKSWTESTRMLKVLCRDPDDHDRVLGVSTAQFLSFDQDASDFASGDFDIVHEDEPPPHAIHRENEARVMSVGGTLMLSMTWPDDPSIPVDWIFDEIYEKGLPGPMKDPGIEWIELDTLLNPHLDQASILRTAANWDEATRTTRIKGQPLRFSNRIHPLFTDVEQTWSFTAGKVVHPDPGGQCPETGTFDTVKFCHVQTFDHSRTWPTIYLLDPHPRKPHMMMWAQIDPADDIQIVQEADCEGDPVEVKKLVDEIERALGLTVVRRLGDPNMLRTPSGARREVLWIDEFRAAGLDVEEADDSDVGRARVNHYLQPDLRTGRPRLLFHARCLKAIYQMKRFTWSDNRRASEKDLKQVPRPKFDDYPALARYLLNFNPEFRMLAGTAPILHTGRSARHDSRRR